MAFKLPDLSYSFDALEPHIDARTMEIHHDKHHAGYTSKLNNAIEGTDLEGKSIEDILANVSKYSTGVRNNGGGFYNHALFWDVMSPNGSAQPDSGLEIHEAIQRDFGSYDKFKEEFEAAAKGRFGSAGPGYAWMITASSSLRILQIRIIHSWMWLTRKDSRFWDSTYGSTLII